MPPPQLPDIPTAIYENSFLVGALNVGFDIRQQGYGETVGSNATVRPIPWAASYTVVIQVGGLQPITRQYRAVVWSETDYGALRSVVGQFGALTTQREGGPQAAMLNSIRRSDMQSQVDPKGAVTVDLEFIMMVTG